jgi:Flp pilus assembly protein CpaB
VAVRRKSTTLILVGVLVFLLGGAGVLIALTRGTNKPSTVATQPAGTSTGPVASNENGSPGTPIGAASLHIPTGMVAVSMSLNSTQAVDGYPVAGDELDIFGVFKNQPAHTSLTPPLAKLVLANVKVLAIQEPAPSTTGGSAELVLALTPSQAESLIFLTTSEAVYTALVPPGTTSIPATPGHDSSNILASAP